MIDSTKTLLVVSVLVLVAAASSLFPPSKELGSLATTSILLRYTSLDIITLSKYLAVGLVLLFLGQKLYTLLFTPFFRYKTLEEVEDNLVREGSWEERRRRAQGTNVLGIGKGRRSKRTKVPGDMPPPYPNSWYWIMFSHELQKGERRDVEYLGQQLVIFRGTKTGKVSVLDAYCPHLGANLGVNGHVEGDSIRCPFHGWAFDGETGQCVDIPYADKPPAFAKTKPWHVHEANGVIYLWFNAENRPPHWYPPTIEGIRSGNYVFHGCAEHEVRAHVLDLPENGPDTAHLNVLHNSFCFELFGLSEGRLGHAWEAAWTPGEEPETHLAHMRVKQHMSLFGKRIPGSDVNVTITQVGPGLVQLHFQTSVGLMTIFESVTPMAPLLQKVTHCVFAEKKVPRFFAKLVFNGMLNQFEKDVPIWNNKTFLSKPLLVKQDGPIGKFRRWCQQFYSEHSNECWKKKT